MIDIKLIREHPGYVTDFSKKKGVSVDIGEILALDQERRFLQSKIDEIRGQRNANATKGAGDAEEGRSIRESLRRLEEKMTGVSEKVGELLAKIPNAPSIDTPIGVDESENVILRTVGAPKEFAFPARTHIEIGRDLGIIDTERASKVAGSRFSYLKGDAALLEFSLIQFAMRKLTDRNFIASVIRDRGLKLKDTPFTPVIPPIFINPEAFKKMARLEPKEERYYIPSDDLYLIGSAEHTLGSMHMDELLGEPDLPIRYVGFSTSLRREAGSAGRDTRGIMRQHQFDKIEMETISIPDNSIEEQELLVGIQEHFMQELGLPYRVVICCTGDMGGPDARHIDIETWLPGEGRYRETHSADLMTDYQSRRLNIKVRRPNKKKDLVHMNDATAFAIGRTIVAILENFQQKDGSVLVPTVLQPYMNKEIITKATSL